jgi:hypothetical protein
VADTNDSANQNRRQQMIKLYNSAAHPNSWVVYVDGSGWLIFPAQENGWEERKPARGLDPLHLREVPVARAANTGLESALELAEVA